MTRAILPGSFDPVTNGHIDLANRALKMFDDVVVAVLINAQKKPLFTVEERQHFIRSSMHDERVRCITFEGLLVDVAKRMGAKVLIRGLRAVSDFEYECQMAMMNRDLAPEIETVFLMPQSCYSFLSSRMVKEVASLRGDVSHLVPPVVLDALRAKFGTPPLDEFN